MRTFAGLSLQLLLRPAVWMAVGLLGVLLLQAAPAVAQAAPDAAAANAQNAVINPQAIACPSCPVMESVIKGSMRLTNDMTTLVTDSLRAFVAALLGVWILLQVGKLLLPFGPLERVPNLFGTVSGMMLMAIAVLFVLGSPGFYKRYILYPIMTTSINASNLILDQAVSIGSAVTTAGPTRSATSNPAAPPQLAQIATPANDQAFETAVSTALVNHVKTVHETLQKGICLGLAGAGSDGCFEKAASNLLVKIGKDFAQELATKLAVVGGTCGALTLGFTIGTTPVGGAIAGGTCLVVAAIVNSFSGNPQEEGRKFMEAVTYVLLLFFILIIYGILWIKYPLYVLDVVMKWAFLSILWPFMAAAMLLPATRGSAFAALKGLGHAALTLVFLAAVIGSSLSVLDQIWNQLGWAQGKAVTINLKTAAQPDYWLMALTGLVMLYLMKECPRMAAAFIDSSMDLRVSEGVWQKVKDAFWMAADVVTAGKAGRVRRVLNLK